MKKTKIILLTCLVWLAPLTAVASKVAVNMETSFPSEVVKLPLTVNLATGFPAVSVSTGSVSNDSNPALPVFAATSENQEAANQPPVTVNFERRAWNRFLFRPSYRLGSDPQKYLWDFGDGAQSDQRVVEHSYQRPGNYAVRLALTDTDQREQLATLKIHVGWFNLANWQLWLVIVALALLIIGLAMMAEYADGWVEEKTNSVKSSRVAELTKPNQPDEEVSLDTLLDSSGELDALSTTGLDQEDLSKELALLESLTSGKKVPENLADEFVTREPGSLEPDLTVTKETAKKKSSSKKLNTKKKVASKKTPTKKVKKKPLIT